MGRGHQTMTALAGADSGRRNRQASVDDDLEDAVLAGEETWSGGRPIAWRQQHIGVGRLGLKATSGEA